jgi:hypothetical protein
VHASPLSGFMLLHNTFAVPPFLGLMSMFLNFKPVHGVLLLQYMPAATLYLYDTHCQLKAREEKRVSRHVITKRWLTGSSP